MERVNQSLAEYEKEEKKKNKTLRFQRLLAMLWRSHSIASSLCEEIKGALQD